MTNDNISNWNQVATASTPQSGSGPAGPSDPETGGLAHPKSLLTHGVWPLLAAVSVWSVWAFGLNRGARYPFSALLGHDDLVPSASGLLLLGLIAATPWLLASSKGARITVASALPLAALATGFLAGTQAGFDPVAYAFPLLAAVSAMVLVRWPIATHRSARLLTPVLSVCLILATQALSPSVPSAAYKEWPTTGSVVFGEACTGREPDLRAPESGWMMVDSLCSASAAYTLSHTAPDGCHSASDAYVFLSTLQGPHANNPNLAIRSAQSYLTGSWLRGHTLRMESGFCVTTNDVSRTFTRPDGRTMYSVEYSTVTPASS